MKAIDRVKSWFRKLGGEDSEDEESTINRPDNNINSNSSIIADQPDKDISKPETQSSLPPAEANATVAKPSRGAVSKAQGVSKAMVEARDFFTEYGEAQKYTIKEVIGKGSYGVVCSAVDNFTGEKVAIKKITNVFEHVSDATRILREIKLLRLLKHPDIVEIKHIMLPPSSRDFKDIYVVFELLETDLHQVIKANDDLTPEHHQFFLYQMLRGLKYIHSAKVFHRDLKPKNILANSDCKLKICDFGLARPAFTDMPSTIFWTDYVATRWYRAPELCGSFFAKYSPAIDIWSVGCIFAEVLLGKPLFPGRNVVHQLELITDLLGTPTVEVLAKVRNDKARRFLANMPLKPGVPLQQIFPRVGVRALALLKRMLAFDPADRPSAEEALADPYFEGLHSASREPSAQPVSKLAFDFDRHKLTMETVRDLIYREVLEYHPNVLDSVLCGRQNLLFPSAVEGFKRQFQHLEAGGAPFADRGAARQMVPAVSLPKEWIADFQNEAARYTAMQPPAQPGRQTFRSNSIGASSSASSAPPTTSSSSNGLASSSSYSLAASAAAAAAAGSKDGSRNRVEPAGVSYAVENGDVGGNVLSHQPQSQQTQTANPQQRGEEGAVRPPSAQQLPGYAAAGLPPANHLFRAQSIGGRCC